MPNDRRAARFIGGAPPVGVPAHRIFVVVHALDVEHIGVQADCPPAWLGFAMAFHTLGRAVLIATAEIPG